MKRILIVIVLVIFVTGCSNVVTEEPTEASDNNSVESVEEVKDDEVNSDKDSTDTDKESIPEYRKITPQEAKSMMVEGNIILDVRTLSEFNQIHIEEALLLPVDQIVEGKLDLLPDKDQTILIYCRSGNRSKTAANALLDAGYSMVYDFGGIKDWPYETLSE